ncbi:TIGR01459 family HAD-type hydrolase [Hyphococcus sp.]|uniref:TIGR01459 family HAD-type hydrolase n=1 Tax=Hyphococcus sp. TaxID=2038636 RepID=UPI002086E57C|nr:MAG: haloacid dehalogenase [Marinicaulis sp.]
MTAEPIGLIGLEPVKSIPVINSIEALAARYDALLCDAWGVIHDGVTLFPGVSGALTRFRETRGPVVILTNAPRPSFVIPPQLDRIGLPRSAYDCVVTSGDATRAAIEARLPSPAYKLGPSKDDPLFDGMAIEFVPLEEAGFIICTGMEDDRHETPDAYRDFLTRAAKRKLPMVCANPDIVVNWGGRMIWCAGALAEIYESLGGGVTYGGKPHAPIYDLALTRIEEIRGPTDRKRILAVGDGLRTDILGANTQNIDVLMIAGDGGVHEGGRDAAAVAAQMEKAGVYAIAAAEALQW